MFAFALWDQRERELSLARDRFGEKPLFVGRTPEGLAFASQLAGVLTAPGFSGDGDPEAIDQFLALSYIPEPRTPFRNVWKLPAGAFARMRPGDVELSPVFYWRASDAALTAHRESLAARAREADIIAQIEQRLQTVIANQMLADVPLGAFLSGGLDSSLVVALMQQASAVPVKTYTIGFAEKEFDESSYAKAVAAHLGTDHTEVILSAQDALDLVPELPTIYDEPFADSSQLPTYLVSRVARQSVTVALTGDAGDEIFGGYNRHMIAARFGRHLTATPHALRSLAGSAMRSLAGSKLMEAGARAAGLDKRVRSLGEKTAKLSAMLEQKDEISFYASLIRRDNNLTEANVLPPQTLKLQERAKAAGFTMAESMMLLDVLGYLPGDVLTKVDRASMAVALETRVPFLDHKLFELTWRLPIGAKIRNGATKQVIRTLLEKHAPRHLFERPKAGFGVPISQWLRGPLRPWLMDLVSSFKREETRHARAADEAVAALNAGDRTIHHFLWNIAMLESWKRRYRTPVAAAA